MGNKSPTGHIEFQGLRYARVRCSQVLKVDHVEHLWASAVASYWCDGKFTPSIQEHEFLGDTLHRADEFPHVIPSNVAQVVAEDTVTQELKRQLTEHIDGMINQTKERNVIGTASGMSASEYASAREQEIASDIEALRSWWVGLAQADIDRTAPKAVEYGAADLEVMGSAMQHLLPGVREIEDLQERRARGLEAAVAFYALGKVARLFGAFEQGKIPNDDSWFDLAIYCGMARKIRETGTWV